MTRSLAPLLALIVAAQATGQTARPAAPAAARTDVAVARLAGEAEELLERDDLVAAREIYRRVRADAPTALVGVLGLGRVHLELGHTDAALRYARMARQLDPDSGEAAALEVQGLLRARDFERAVRISSEALEVLADPGPALWSAHASALFRVQRTDEAAAAYRRVLVLDPMDAEAHVRLGSGLTAPGAGTVRPAALDGAHRLLQRGDLDGAVAGLLRAIEESPDHPVVHRLLGDTLLRRTAERSFINSSPEFAALQRALPRSVVAGPVVEKFLPGFGALDPARRAVAARALRLFWCYLPRLVTIGGRHDLLAALERTTDHPARAKLRGRRTFDGRVWDDVRGIGGLRAATGIEALDEAGSWGFDTLVHEVAHQVHLYVLPRSLRLRIRELFETARDEDRFLDYYAANNEAEYFAQGVEAFVSYGKRPGREPTHGHTRFELYRVDRALHDVVASIVDHDPLRDPAHRGRILPAAVEVALRCGRPHDAVVAAEMMEPGLARDRLLARARLALVAAGGF